MQLVLLFQSPPLVGRVANLEPLSPGEPDGFSFHIRIGPIHRRACFDCALRAQLHRVRARTGAWSNRGLGRKPQAPRMDSSHGRVGCWSLPVGTVAVSCLTEDCIDLTSGGAP